MSEMEHAEEPEADAADETVQELSEDDLDQVAGGSEPVHM